MATLTCSFNLRTASTSVGVPTGGKWYYKGYSSTEGGPYDDTPATSLFPSLVIDDEIPGGDNPVVYTLGVTAGYYLVQYQYPGNILSRVIKITTQNENAGNSDSLSFSTSDNNTYNLLTFTGGLPGGTWTDLDGAGAGFNNGEITPSNFPSPGVYEFLYSFKVGNYEEIDCQACPPLESTITVTIDDGFTVSIVQSAGTCDYTISMENPDTALANQAKLLINANDSAPTFSQRRKVTSTCGEELYNQVINQQTFSIHLYNKVNNLADGGNLEYITAYSTTQGAITIPLAPSGVNMAVMSGVGGNVTAGQLVFNSASPNTFEDAITFVIRNYLGTLGYVEGVNYNLFPTTVEVDDIFIFFRCKHNPTTEWIGLDNALSTIEYVQTSGGIPQTSGTPEILDIPLTIDFSYDRSPCPINLRYRTNPTNSPAWLDEPNVTYNSIPLAGIATSFSLHGSSVLVEQCASTILTATPQNCAGNVTYLWNTGDTTNSINRVSGTFSVDADCDNPVETDTDTITL